MPLPAIIAGVLGAGGSATAGTVAAGTAGRAALGTTVANMGKDVAKNVAMDQFAGVLSQGAGGMPQVSMAPDIATGMNDAMGSSPYGHNAYTSG